MSRLFAALVDVAAAPLATTSRIQRADAIAVLGARVRPDGSMSDALAERVSAGAEIYHRGLAPLVYVTGGDRHGHTEAEPMVARLRELGVPDQALRVDRTAENTRENALRVAEGLFPGAVVWVVTQPFHLRRSLREFRAAGLRPLGWHIADSIQHRAPRQAISWVAREYLALLRPRLPR